MKHVYIFKMKGNENWKITCEFAGTQAKKIHQRCLEIRARDQYSAQGRHLTTLRSGSSFSLSPTLLQPLNSFPLWTFAPLAPVPLRGPAPHTGPALTDPSPLALDLSLPTLLLTVTQCHLLCRWLL